MVIAPASRRTSSPRVKESSGQTVAAAQVHEHRLSGRQDHFLKHLAKAQGLFRLLGRAVGPCAQHDPPAGVEQAGVAQVGEHVVHPIHILVDVLQEEDLVAGIQGPGRAKGGGDQRQVAADQRTYGHAGLETAGRIARRVLQQLWMAEEDLFHPVPGKGVKLLGIPLGGGHGRVVAGKAQVVKGNMQGGHVGIAEERLPMGRDGGDVQQGQEAVGAIAAADAQHPGETVVQEGVGQIAGAQFVCSGQISVASPATVVHHGLQSEGFHGLDGPLPGAPPAPGRRRPPGRRGRPYEAWEWTWQGTLLCLVHAERTIRPPPLEAA